MSKSPDSKTEKLNGKQLVETVKDVIYEVLEEELDKRLEAKKKNKKKLGEAKTQNAKKLEESKAQNRTLKTLREKKERLKEAIAKLDRMEKGLLEKWGRDVEVEKTGEHAGKSVEEIKKRLAALKAKEDKSEAEKKEQDQLVFALRAKTGWKKGEGATKK